MAPAFIRRRAADAAGDTFQEFQPGQTVSPGFDRDRFQFGARPAVKTLARHLDPAEMGLRQANDRAAKPAVFHQQIRAAPENEERSVRARGSKPGLPPDPVLKPVRRKGPPARRPAAWCVWPAARRDECTVARETRCASSSARLRSAPHRLIQNGIRRLKRPSLPAAACPQPLRCADLQSAGLRGTRALRFASGARQPGSLAKQPAGDRRSNLRRPRLPGPTAWLRRSVPPHAGHAIARGRSAFSHAPPVSRAGPKATAPACPAWPSSAPATGQRQWLQTRGHCETGDCRWLPGKGSSTAGTRMAASSASDDAPARQTAAVAAPSATSISARNGCTTAFSSSAA